MEQFNEMLLYLTELKHILTRYLANTFYDLFRHIHMSPIFHMKHVYIFAEGNIPVPLPY